MSQFYHFIRNKVNRNKYQKRLLQNLIPDAIRERRFHSIPHPALRRNHLSAFCKVSYFLWQN